MMLLFISGGDEDVITKYANYYKLENYEDETFLIFALQVIKECGNVKIGDTILLEQTCEPGKLHISKEYYNKIKNYLQNFLHVCKETERGIMITFFINVMCNNVHQADTRSSTKTHVLL